MPRYVRGGHRLRRRLRRLRRAADRRPRGTAVPAQRQRLLRAVTAGHGPARDVVYPGPSRLTRPPDTRPAARPGPGLTARPGPGLTARPRCGAPRPRLTSSERTA